jgi:para-aminobenzoate synthetase/4-amino-4-deoxychorismate lyase
LDGELITPRLDCGLIKGTVRERLLNEGVLKEGIIHVSDLINVSQV